MLTTLFSNPLLFVIWAAGIVLALTVHEYSHARAADHLGDPTPRAAGRLTLNPLAHLDPLGTLLIVFIGFGWGRPVEFDPYNLRNPRRDTAFIALAGPASNLVIAALLSLATHLFGGDYSLLTALLTPIILINISLAIFNLVPVFPLDGEKILKGFLPTEMAVEYDHIMRQYGTLILILLLLPILGGVSPISALISPIITTIAQILI